MAFPPDPATTHWVPLYNKNVIKGDPGNDGTPGMPGAAGPTTIGPMGIDGEDGRQSYLGESSEFPRTDINNLFKSHNSFKSYHSPLYDNGNSGGAVTIDWNNGNDQLLVLTAACVITFANPRNGGRYVIILKGGFLVSWPAAVAWPSSLAPTFASSAYYNLITFMYIESLGRYVGSYNLEYTL